MQLAHLRSETQCARIMVVLDGAELGFRKDLNAQSPVIIHMSAFGTDPQILKKLPFLSFCMRGKYPKAL